MNEEEFSERITSINGFLILNRIMNNAFDQQESGCECGSHIGISEKQIETRVLDKMFPL